MLNSSWQFLERTLRITLILTCWLTGSMHVHAATPCTGGLSGGLACDSVDLASHVPLASISSNPSAANDIWGFVDLNSLREYVLMGVENGIAVFDVTDAENPLEVGLVPGQSTVWRDVKVYQFHDAAAGRWRAYAYVTADSVTEGMFVIDLSGLPNRVARVPYSSDFIRAHNVYAANTDYGTGLSLDGTAPQLIVSGSNLDLGRFRIYGLDNPSSPVFRATSLVAGDIHDATSLFVTDARKDANCVNAAGADACEVFVDFGEDAVDIWDITVPTDPRRLSQTTYPLLGYVHSGCWSEDRQFVFVQDELDERDRGQPTRLIVLSIADLTSPVVAGTWTGPTNAIDHNGFARGNRYYMSNYRRGLTVLDITSPASPTDAGFLDTYPANDAAGFDGAWGTYPFLWSGHIAISDIDTGLYIAQDRTLDVVAGRIGFSASHYSVLEGTPAEISVVRTGGSAGAASVRYEIVPGTTDSSDIQLSGTLNWADGETGARSIAVDATADGLSEGLELAVVKLVDPQGGATLGNPNVAIVYLDDPGAASTLELLDDRIDSAETGFARAIVVVGRSGSAIGTASIEFTISGGDAVSGSDFDGPASGVLSWDDGDARPRVIEYRILDDTLGEAAEFFELTFSNPVGAALSGSDIVRVTIAGSDGGPHGPPPPAPQRGGGGGSPAPLVLLAVGAALLRRLSRKG